MLMLSPLSLFISNLCTMCSTVAYCWAAPGIAGCWHAHASVCPLLRTGQFPGILASKCKWMSFPGEAYILCSIELRQGRYKPKWCLAVGYSVLSPPVTQMYCRITGTVISATTQQNCRERFLSASQFQCKETLLPSLAWILALICVSSLVVQLLCQALI